MSILVWIITGIIAGWLAGLVARGRGFGLLGDLVVGLIGGLIGGFFAGESRFHRVNNASKVALFHLTQHLRRRGFVLFDIQMLTPVTAQLGGVTLPRKEYLERLADAVKAPMRF